VLRFGRRHRTNRLDIAWYPNDTGHPRLGVVVPRHGQAAVARNRLRRRVREIARRRVLPQLGPVDLVLRARAGAYRATFDALTQDLGEWLSSQ
jgi:ribonuclease P protein component